MPTRRPAATPSHGAPRSPDASIPAISMKYLPLALLGLLLVSGCGAERPTPGAPPHPSTGEAEPAPSAEPEADATSSIFLVRLGPFDDAGETFGCGDRLERVSRTIPAGGDPLAAALGALFAAPDGDRLTNHVQGLSVESIERDAGVARVYLSGPLALRGVCDHPRVEQQLRRTALHLPGIDSVALFLDGEPLAEVLSLRGDG